METAVLLLIYKRPDLTKKVVDSIRKARPKKLYIVADGPKDEKDRVLCEQTRKAAESVDWNCRVFKNYADKNMGLRKRVSSGITWFFEKEDRGIVLEDDCVADPSFYKFCEELLEKYKDDERIMAISGSNFQFGKKRTNYSYYFSRHNHCWGWASWRRAWNYYDDGMKLWPDLKEGNWLKDILGNYINELYWVRIFNLVYKNEINSWAYRWTYSCWIQSGLTILPNVNLVKNIGFGKKATNTKLKNDKASVDSVSVNFPLKHPPYVVRDSKADKITDYNRFLTPMIIGGLIYRSIRAKIGI